MIESIEIAGIATFGSAAEELRELAQLNFLFGSNGSGKTTISRVIADESISATCRVKWKGGTKLQAMVYNRDFVEKNFNQSAELRGVFTLGEKQVDALAKIATAKVELDALTNKIEALTLGLQGDDGNGGKRGELSKLEVAFKDTCWTRKQKHDAALQGAFEGYRASSEKFKTKVLQEAGSTAALLTLAELEKKAESVFGEAPSIEVAPPALDAEKLIWCEKSPILAKRILGKEEVDIAAMIKKLNNSDWVREGRAFFEINGSSCPFCQQSTSQAFAQSLNEYFDETFVADCKAIDDLVAHYKTESARLAQQIGSIIAAPSKFVDIDKLGLEKQLLDSKIIINLQRLDEKKKEPSQVVELEAVGNVIGEINATIEAANVQVLAHNAMVANLSHERSALTAQVWRYVLEELKGELEAYDVARDGLGKAIASMSAQIEAAGVEKSKKVAEISQLEKLTTSVQPTVDAINKLLASFGFRGFLLAKSVSGTSYKLVRSDGSDAKSTLSEGERTFVTFLYFYHLLRGSDSESGMTTNRVVVFDDPVSSLDSDILFIVSSLIKGLFDELRSGLGYIKQIFILTHNVYFHKEVTYNKKRPDKGACKGETFWVVRKPGTTSKLERHAINPIRTSYELLWAEIKKPERSGLAIQNTLRRILENYFKLLGGMDFDDLCAMFDGKDKLICKSLCSWMHDGSHYAHDDLYVSIDDSAIENYLNVFRSIFEKSKHMAHYRMMMGDAFIETISSDTAQLT